MKKFINRLWQCRWVRGCLWLIIVVFEALILFRQYVDWSGKRRWLAVQEMLAREGESLDPRKTAPNPVPDGSNFCTIPLLKDMALVTSKNKDDKSELSLKHQRLLDALPADPIGFHMPKLIQGAALGKAMDLKVWADWFRPQGWLAVTPDSGNPARDVLAALSRDDQLVSELALGLSRLESQWTPAWKTRALPKLLFAIELSHYSALQRISAVLGLRSVAAARAGDAVKAHESLIIDVRIDQAFMKEPFIIGTLVASGISVLISGAVWELCDAHSGTTEDFRALQEALSQLDLRKTYLCAERGELAAAANAGEYLKRTRDTDFLLNKPSTKGDTPHGLYLIPDGCFDAKTAVLVRWHFDYYIKPLRDAGFKELLAKQVELQSLISEHKGRLDQHPDELLALIAMPALGNVCYKVVYTQSLVNEAIAACALERYRIEHGSYPGTLEAANRAGEKSIPLDIISGKAMGYRKTPDGRYALWCVGSMGRTMEESGFSIRTIRPGRSFLIRSILAIGCGIFRESDLEIGIRSVAERVSTGILRMPISRLA